MLTVNKLISQGRGLAPVLVKRAASVELDWDVRQKSRFDATDSLGRALGVFLPRGTLVRGGDLLVAEDGSMLRVQAAAQPVLIVRSAPNLPFDLLRAAYHLGNRHVPLELRPDHLKLEPDHVLAALLRQMGLSVTEAQDAFEPEGGAYGTAGAGGGAHRGHAHGDGHGHGHEHEREHEHEHQHEHSHADGHDHGADAHDHGHSDAATHATAPAGAAAPHVHGPGCRHGDDHAH